MKRVKEIQIGEYVQITGMTGKEPNHHDDMDYNFKYLAQKYKHKFEVTDGDDDDNTLQLNCTLTGTYVWLNVKNVKRYVKKKKKKVSKSIF